MLLRITSVLLAALSLASCATPIGPTQVTRFHLPERICELGQGSIAIVPVDEDQAGTSAWRAFEQRLAQALTAQGYVVVDHSASGPGSADQQARIAYRIIDAEDINSGATVTRGGPPTFGGQSIGLGLTIPLSGQRRNLIFYQLELRIVDSTSDQVLWEGRGQSQAKAGSADTAPDVFAGKLISALFSDFPGRSGETIAVP